MEFAACNSLYSVMTAQQERRPFSWATVRRILAFARPRRRMLAGFILLSVVGAILAVATPLLAGEVVDALVNRQSFTLVWQLAVLIAVIAVAEAAVGLVSRWMSARIGEGLILDLRQAVFDHVQKMPIAFFTRTRSWSSPRALVRTWSPLLTSLEPSVPVEEGASTPNGGGEPHEN